MGPLDGGNLDDHLDRTVSKTGALCTVSLGEELCVDPVLSGKRVDQLDLTFCCTGPPFLVPLRSGEDVDCWLTDEGACA